MITLAFCNYVFSSKVRIPCCPVSISCRKLSRLIQTIAETSTPNAGGTSSLTGTRSGSVGHTIALKGRTVRSVFGYHEITVRHTNRKFIAKMKASRIGPMTFATAIDPSAASATPGTRLTATVATESRTSCLLIDVSIGFRDGPSGICITIFCLFNSAREFDRPIWKAVPNLRCDKRHNASIVILASVNIVQWFDVCRDCANAMLLYRLSPIATISHDEDSASFKSSCRDFVAQL